MVKTRIVTRIVAATLVLAALMTGLVFDDSVRAQKDSQPDTENGGQASFIPTMSADIFSPTKSDCFSAEHHAASDCDRLTSQASAKSFGPATANCYSVAYHAASDCDRLASQRIAQFVGLTTASCFSAAFHAASDCDRLATQSIAQFFGPTTANCFSAAYHAASDCDRLVFEMSNALAYK